MSDTEQRIQEIRARLAAATTRPWMTDVMENIGENWLVANCGSDDAGISHIVTTDDVHGSEVRGDAEADAVFIANAPSDMEFLLDQIEAAVKAAREECANVAADTVLPAYEDCRSWLEYGVQTAMNIAAAIRSRGEESK